MTTRTNATSVEMTFQGKPKGQDHVLLIGIDAYRGVEPLYGAANDVDAVEEILLRRLGISPKVMTKLVARRGAARPGERAPTLDNIRAELEKLASHSVQPGDRVLVLYSGHGTRIDAPGGMTSKEALVPVDGPEDGALLWDHEMNDALRNIAKRTNDVTVLLDCCFSASVTRGAFPASRPRTCHVRAMVPTAKTFDGEDMLSGLNSSDPGYVVAASAQANETATEVSDSTGTCHSAFVAALLHLFERRFVGDLRSLRWSDIWPYLRAEVSARSPGQHPCLIGRSERRVFGGPYRRGDPGITLVHDGAAYRIDAGRLAGLNEGAEIAVYGPEPPDFEPLGVDEDVRLRRGVLRVESVDLTSARAVPVDKPIALRVGDRGRLIKPGPMDRLVVAMRPFDAKIARDLENAAHVNVVAFGGDDVEAVVGRAPDGRWWIGDAVFGPDAPLGWAESDKLWTLAPGLIHYARFNQPLRLARRSLTGGHRLGLMVLNAATVQKLRRDELSNAPFLDVRMDVDGGCRYRVVDGQDVCFSVWNHGERTMYVQLFNCASSGKVQLLGTQQVSISPNMRHIFWLGGHIGEPFQASVSPGRTWNIDRLVAVGTESPDVSLSGLEVEQSFADAMFSTPRGEQESDVAGPEWEATCVPVRIVRA